MRFRNRHAPRLGAPCPELAEDIADRDRAHLRSRHAGDLEHRHCLRGLHLDLDLLVVELAGAQAFAESILGGGTGIRADQGIDHAFLGVQLGARAHILALALMSLHDRAFEQVADDLLDVLPHIADLGELGRLDLDEGCARELGEQATRDLRLADAGRAESSECSWAALPRAVARRARAAASGCATRSQRRAWRRADR